jgi:iron complex transport system substrate-binding protein
MATTEESGLGPWTLGLGPWALGLRAATPWLVGVAVGGGLSWSATAAAQAPVNRAPATNVTHGCVERFDATVDYFPDKLTIEDATSFRVEYRRFYKLVAVTEAYAGGPSERYVLVQCGAPAPALVGPLAGAQVVTVPITSLFALSPTHVSLLVELDRVKVLTGVAQRDIVSSPEIEARLTTGAIAEFARAGLQVDVERVVTARPSAVMANGAVNATLSAVRNAGVPVVANTEWREPTALGRAEWLKYMALFLNEERAAQALYGSMKARYRTLSARATTQPQQTWPLVMTGRSTRGTFVIAGGRSYVAALIRDAGGRYAWADNHAAGTAAVDLEAQMQRASRADVWINGGGWANRAAMLEDEPRYAEFKAFRQGQVWVYERRMTPAGGNDYWSRGVTSPDLVLADLVKILHPSLTPGHAFEWYMPVPAR